MLFTKKAPPMKTTVRPITSWAYQLQNADPDAIHLCESDVVVIDAFNGSGVRWSRDDMNRMQTTKSGKRRRVIAYVSIGEAEDYRPYWSKIQGAPYLDDENPEWRGNYKVKFWMQGWQDIMFLEMDNIMKTGFDGVYMDIIDGYEYYEAKGRNDAAYEMADFVIAISERIKAKNPKAWIVPQNGEGLLAYREYRNAIDAIGKEDIYYGANTNGVRNDSSYTREVEGWLVALSGSGKPVLSVEYDLSTNERDRYRRDARHVDGIVTLVTRRALDVLVCPT